MEILERLPYRKSAQLIRLPQETINTFFETAELTLGENKFTIEQILEMRLPSLSKFISNFLNKENPKEKKKQEPHDYPLPIQRKRDELIKSTRKAVDLMKLLASPAATRKLVPIVLQLEAWLEEYLDFK